MMKPTTKMDENDLGKIAFPYNYKLSFFYYKIKVLYPGTVGEKKPTEETVPHF